VKLAIEAGVPVVPMTIHGAHESMFVLTRGTNLARRLGLNRVHVKILPLVLAVPVGISPFGLGAMRLPSKVTVQLGPPLDWSRYTAADAEDPEVLDRCYVEITGVMQSTLDSLHREHPHPIRERLSELRPRKIVRRMLRRA
jgi:1-acyl-sn-glycerol-3-phosphate acyltransferase